MCVCVCLFLLHFSQCPLILRGNGNCRTMQHCLTIKIMQAIGKETCFQFSKLSLSYAKIVVINKNSKYP